MIISNPETFPNSGQNIYLEDTLETAVKCYISWLSGDAIGNTLESGFIDTSLWEFISRPGALVVLEKTLPWGIEPVTELELCLGLG